jgi:hypothetical protein
MIGLLPGWVLFNFLTTIPAALLGAIISGIAIIRTRSGSGLTGLVISLAVIAIAILRIIIGKGVV